MHVVSEDHAINQDRRARVKYFGFTALVGVLLLLNVLGVFDTFLGVNIFAQNIVFGAVLILAVAITIDRSKIPIVK